MAVGFVVSDLHLFSSRSHARDHVPVLRRSVSTADFAVFNGDTFEFRWTSLPSIEETARAAERWVDEIAADHPRCHFHFVQGNHDAVAPFDRVMGELARRRENVSWHPYYLRLGSHLFLHGDVTTRRMDADALRRARARWARDRKRGAVLSRYYDVVNGLGIDRMVLRAYYRRRPVVRRLLHYVESLGEQARDGISDVYFGHTHLAFSDYCFRGIRFHNTGSAVRGSRLEPRRVRVDDLAIPAVDGAART